MEYYSNMQSKLGLGGDIKDMKDLVDDLLDLMAESGADFTVTFRLMSTCVRMMENTTDDNKDKFLDILTESCLSSYQDILESLKPSMPIQQIQTLVMVARAQPYLLHQFPKLLDDLKKLKQLDEFKKVTEEEWKQNCKAKWKSWLAKYRKRIRMDLTGSDTQHDLDAKKLESLSAQMNKANPKFILRNYILQSAIEEAEKGNYAKINALLKLVRNPYDENPGGDSSVGITGVSAEEYVKFTQKPTPSALAICVT